MEDSKIPPFTPSQQEQEDKPIVSVSEESTDKGEECDDLQSQPSCAQEKSSTKRSASFTRDIGGESDACTESSDDEESACKKACLDLSLKGSSRQPPAENSIKPQDEGDEIKQQRTGSPSETEPQAESCLEIYVQNLVLPQHMNRGTRCPRISIVPLAHLGSPRQVSYQTLFETQDEGYETSFPRFSVISEEVLRTEPSRQLFNNSFIETQYGSNRAKYLRILVTSLESHSELYEQLSDENSNEVVDLSSGRQSPRISVIPPEQLRRDSELQSEPFREVLVESTIDIQDNMSAETERPRISVIPLTRLRTMSETSDESSRQLSEQSCIEFRDPSSGERYVTVSVTSDTTPPEIESESPTESSDELSVEAAVAHQNSIYDLRQDDARDSWRLKMLFLEHFISGSEREPQAGPSQQPFFDNCIAPLGGSHEIRCQTTTLSQGGSSEHRLDKSDETRGSRTAAPPPPLAPQSEKERIAQIVANLILQPSISELSQLVCETNLDGCLCPACVFALFPDDDDNDG